MKYSYYSRIFIFLLLSFLILSCESDNAPIIYNKDSNEYVNEWMYDQMKKYYRWNTSMPAQGNLSLNPKEYFKNLLQKEDVYSYAIHPALPDTAPQSLRRSFGFDVSFVEFGGKYYGVIVYTLAGSPAKNSGLQRGQLITKIDGTVLNAGNYEQLYKNMVGAAKLNLETISFSSKSGFSNPKEIAVLQGFSFSQPIPYQIISDKNAKIGYVEIPHFDVGQAQQFLQIFQELKNKSITELVLDLRYNGGGDIASATALSIILAPNIKATDLFIKFEGNANGGNVDQSFEQALKSNEAKISFDALRGAHPSINRIYILCGNRTASASELIINNLKSYMNVIALGGKTFGKDVAGFPIEDDRIPGSKGWVLYPSIYKLFNSRHEGGYSKGIDPNIYTDELQELEVFPLGNRSEILLSAALRSISGNTGKMKAAELQLLRLSKVYTDSDPLLRFNP